MTIRTFNASEMRKIIDQSRPRPTFFLDKFYPETVRADNNLITIESLPNRGRKLAPRVHPYAPGRPIGNSGTDVRAFRPTYLKHSTIVDPFGPVELETVDVFSVNYEVSPESRVTKERARITKQHVENITDAWEWMAAMATINGWVNTFYPGKPDEVVSFGRDPSLTVAKTAGTYWGDSGVSIMDDLAKFRRLMHNAKGGKSGSVLLVGAEVADLLNREARHGEFKDLMDTRYPSDGTSLLRGLEDPDEISFLGRISGKLEVYQYSVKFPDVELGVDGEPVEVERQPLGDNEICLVARNIEGIKAFGRIQDDDAGNKAIPLFGKNYRSIISDRSVETVVHQSAPIMIPGNPNATFKATVLPA